MAYRRSKHRCQDRRLRRLQVEVLEDRRMLAVATVTTHLDVVNSGDGVTSLREAISATNSLGGDDRIEFAASLNGATINLNLALGELDITDSLTIDASGLASGLKIDARDGADGMFATGDGIRIFDIDDGSSGTTINVELIGLTLTGSDKSLAIPGDGGAVRTRENLTVSFSTISGNATVGEGGAVWALGEVTIADSTISGNSAHQGGGGIYSSQGFVQVHRSTIADNHATNPGADGGGISIPSGNLQSLSTIIAGNTAGDAGQDIYRLPSVVSPPLQVDYSLIGDSADSQVSAATGAGNLLDMDPLLGPLANNGGPTLTHMPLAGSPVINAGSIVADDAPTYDQRGPIYSRVYAGRIDMGAVEVQPQHADFDTDVDVDGLDFLAWQIGFGTTAPNAAKADGDADGDGDVDGVDLAAWEAAYGTTFDFTDISIAFLDGPEEITDGVPAVYTLVVTNDGTADVIGIGVLSELSAALANVSWTAVITGNGAGTLSGTGDIDELVNLAAESAITYTITADVAIPNADEPALRHIINSAQVAIPLGVVDYIGANNEAYDIDLVQAEVTGGAAHFVASGEVIGNQTSRAVALGDLDGDGDLDAVITRGGSGGTRVNIRMNNGSGSFAASSAIALPANEVAYAVALGDLDNDGDLDLVMSGQVNRRVWHNNGVGGFAVQETVVLWRGGFTDALKLADVDGDGDLDVVTTTDTGTPTVLRTEIWLNDGTGLFTGTGQKLLGNHHLEVGDVDGDGDGDILGARTQQSGQILEDIHLWLNDGSGEFAYAGVAIAGDHVSSRLGDLDGDGDLDAVVATSVPAPSRVVYTVWLNDGTGAFVDTGQQHNDEAPGSTVDHPVAIGDLDGDGDLDFVSPYSGNLWRNDGTGQFTAALSGITGTPIFTIAALGDLDRDGDLDVYRVNPSQTTGDIVLFNQAALLVVDPQIADAIALALVVQGNQERGEVVVFEEPPTELPQDVAFAELGASAAPMRVTDFGDLAASRPREEDSSAVKASLDDQLVISAL